MKIAALAVMAVFYAAYFLKMLLQHRKGIQTDQIGKGRKPKKVLRIECFMKIATFAVVPAELFSILTDRRTLSAPIGWAGIALAALGTGLFIIAMASMRDSWRAGIPESDQTALVTWGIYRFSRNPAFLGFDLVYIGLLIAYLNPIHLLFVLFAVGMLHLQILQEERFLEFTFGEAYLSYKKRTGRYLIW